MSNDLEDIGSQADLDGERSELSMIHDLISHQDQQFEYQQQQIYGLVKGLQEIALILQQQQSDRTPALDEVAKKLNVIHKALQSLDNKPGITQADLQELKSEQTETRKAVNYNSTSLRSQQKAFANYTDWRFLVTNVAGMGMITAVVSFVIQQIVWSQSLQQIESLQKSNASVLDKVTRIQKHLGISTK